MIRHHRPSPSCTLALLAVLLATTASGAYQSAHAQEGEASLEALQRQIETRDRQIAQQQELIDQLARRLSAVESRLDAPSEPPIAAVAPPPLPAPPAPEPAPGPGQFEVDPTQVERALERTLTAEGALLVPAGAVEVSPSVSYTRRDDGTPSVVTIDGDTFIGENDVERDEFEFEVDMRIGLPFDAQLELGLPYEITRQENVSSVGFLPRDQSSDTGQGFGDVSLGLAKTLWREGVYAPDLVGRFSWEPSTGQNSDNDVGLGNGFNPVTVSLSATKSQDPLAFIGSLGYRWNFEDDDFRPGNEFLLSFGALLGASPGTSLRTVLAQSFADDFELDGNNIDGSNQVNTTLNFGASSFLFPGGLLDVNVGVGLTEDAPDYEVIVSLPIRFGLPTF